MEPKASSSSSSSSGTSSGSSSSAPGNLASSCGARNRKKTDRFSPSDSNTETKTGNPVNTAKRSKVAKEPDSEDEGSDSDDKPLITHKAKRGREEQKGSPTPRLRSRFHGDPTVLALTAAATSVVAWLEIKAEDEKRVKRNKETEEKLSQMASDLEIRKQECESRAKDLREKEVKLEADLLMVNKMKMEAGAEFLAKLLARSETKCEALEQKISKLEQELEGFRSREIDSFGSNSVS